MNAKAKLNFKSKKTFLFHVPSVSSAHCVLDQAAVPAGRQSVSSSQHADAFVCYVRKHPQAHYLMRYVPSAMVMASCLAAQK